ncbi:MAG: Ribosomal protein L11 methyltransferase [Alphaproteobacteria bacterium MarineAlpha9_Bin3]|nr:MAG: Ribosomal protein L11 methyltransferase [Alphaproteobacteria bacterium MarineAlpha9_Bin3]
MSSIWVLKLKLREKLREDIEEYLISLNATVTSIDAENNTNSLKPKIFKVSAFFTKKPKNYLIQFILINYKVNPNRVFLKKVSIEDIYKKYSQPLQPINIGPFKYSENKNKENFLIKKNIIIPAGLGFGSGHHASTQGIIILIYKIFLKKNIKNKKIIDIGCGSGILGITMAKLWKKKIELIDIDKHSVITSKENAKLNYLNSLIKAKKGNSLKRTNEFKYDIIVMNILANTIMDNIYLINKKLNKNGRVILSGILKHQKFMILNKLRSLGLILELEYINDNWITLLIKK